VATVPPHAPVFRRSSSALRSLTEGVSLPDAKQVPGEKQPDKGDARPFAQAQSRIKKPALHLFRKVQRRLRPGLPPTAVQRQAGVPSRITDPKIKVSSAASVPVNTATKQADIIPTAAACSTPPEESKAKILPMPVRETPPSKDNRLVLQGDYWEVTYGGRTSMLEDTRGLRYVALLIRQAGQGPIYANELVAFATGNPSTVELENREALMDSTAENRLVKRLEQIGFERNSASAQANYERVAALDEEVDSISEELQRIRTPHNGRATFNNSAEKARKAVSKAISEAIARMAAYPDLEPLASHLSTAIQKGQWLSYNGTEPWDIDFQIPVAEKLRSKTKRAATPKVAAAKAGNLK
jgi:hypothetical protein